MPALEGDLMIAREVVKWYKSLMRKRRVLSDLYQFPGCKPKSTVHGVFGDPQARVIKLVRQGKKLPVGYVARSIEPIVLAKSDWFAISPAEAPGSIWNWKSGASCVGGADQ
jgi:hypothetical protein